MISIVINKISSIVVVNIIIIAGGGAVRFKGELIIKILIFKFTPVGRGSAGVINDIGIVGGEDGMGRRGVPFQQNIGRGGTGVAL